MANSEPYTVGEVVNLLWLWSSELSNIANDMQNGTEPSDKILVLKARRVSKEITELIDNTKGLKDVKTS